MIIQCDAKGLEIYCGAFLSQDKLLMQTLLDGVDIHGENQKLLGLPEGEEGRLVAKIFIFRLMYGGTAYAYAHDSDFMWISTSEKFWQKKIDQFYDRYIGFAKWHETIVNRATLDGQLIMPTGRIYKYDLEVGYHGERKAPVTKIKNYPVQGLGADIMAIARVSFFRRWNNAGNINGVLINTVHDSIVCDIHSSEMERLRGIYMDVFKALPDNFYRVFGVVFNLPLICEVKCGDNTLEMKEI